MTQAQEKKFQLVGFRVGLVEGLGDKTFSCEENSLGRQWSGHGGGRVSWEKSCGAWQGEMNGRVCANGAFEKCQTQNHGHVC